MADEKPIVSTIDLAISDEEIRESFSGPAFLSNRILLTRTAAGARLAFMERRSNNTPSTLRAAVIIPYQDALALRDLLSIQLKEIEEQLKTAAAEAKATAERAKQSQGQADGQ